MQVVGVNRVYLMPERSGICGSLLRSREQGIAALGEYWPEVELCLTDDLWVGSQAMWKPERNKEIFVTFAEADAIGLPSNYTLILKHLSQNYPNAPYLCRPSQVKIE